MAEKKVIPVRLTVGGERISLEQWSRAYTVPRSTIPLASVVGVSCHICAWEATKKALVAMPEGWISKADRAMWTAVIPEEKNELFYSLLEREVADCPRGGISRVEFEAAQAAAAGEADTPGPEESTPRG